MDLLKEHEEFLDRVALEHSSRYFERQVPQSDADRILVATMSYKQALAMLEVKLGLEAVLGKTNYLVRHRIKSKVREKEVNL